MMTLFPHHTVTIKNKFGKVHRTANALSTIHGHSLNYNLLKKRDLLSNLTVALFVVIMRFCED